MFVIAHLFILVHICSILSKFCRLLKCKPPPKICPNGEAPVIPLNDYCQVCITEPLRCSLLRCATAPQKCPGNRPMVKVHPGDCCAECTKDDCSKVKCVSPTRYCNKEEIPRPRGSCCATCNLDCSGTYCMRLAAFFSHNQ